ncbi:peptidoglycan bridge formation glycyltransferase FemA/FemB family protein, partial [Candidatus Saccharibacteria bacterium]|nr:peptidoglycan bridge formation glycyltransferase FemA/FemB family protein [Candidatus Saccharibacteria bacterium]
YLLNLQKSLAKKKGINTFSEDYLKTELSQPFSTLYLVRHLDDTTNKSEIIAAGLIFDDKTTRYNLQGAQTEAARALHATGILTIQLILDAKAKGLKLFDFWGIAPEGAPDSHPWKGFTNFKKTFAGYEVEHAGTHDIVLKPAKYKLYQALRKINRRRKK